jgi:hypothetical protein
LPSGWTGVFTGWNGPLRGILYGLILILARWQPFFTFVSLKRMVKNHIPKKLMLAAGILAALVILFSQAFQKETCSFLSKIRDTKTEKKAEAEKQIVIAAPADAVTSGQAVEVGDTHASLIREIIFGETNATETPLFDKAILSDLVKAFLRVVISPQAP